MFLMTLVLGILTFITGILLLFRFSLLQQMSRSMTRVIFNETWVAEHRVAIGILLLGITCFLAVGAYFSYLYGA